MSSSIVTIPSSPPMSPAIISPPMSPHDADDMVEWDICCSKSSKSFIKYLTTVSISIIVLIFCIVMIFKNPDANNSIYFSLISSIITLYIPAPTLDGSK